MANTTVLRSSSVCTTILGTLNQFQTFTNQSYLAANMFTTTLNSLYGILNDEAHRTLTEAPNLLYFGIGVNGFKNTDTDQGALAYPADARVMNLYRQIPFRVIPQSEFASLSPTIKEKYRLWKLDGSYYKAYLKKIDYSKSAITLTRKDPSTGAEYDYSLDPGWLSPDPPNINTIGGSVNTNINRVIVRLSGICRIEYEEILEYIQNVMEGDMSNARISELGYYTGIECPAGESTGLGYTEAAFVQLAKHHCFRGIDLNTAGSYIEPTITLESECCINEPL